MSFDAQYFNRRSRDILEDYDLELYADPNGYPGSDQRSELAVPRLRLLRLHREPGLELRHRHARRRQARLQRSRVRVPQALRQSLAAADVVQLAGREGQHQLRLERRLPGRRGSISIRARPNQYATQPGLIRHLTKGAASYTFDFGLQLGGTFSWNSGTVASRTFLSSGRNLPIRVSAAEAFSFAGYTNRWLAPTVGSLENPAWGKVDLRAQYNRRISGSRERRVLRRPVQRHEQPVVDP